ncbi:MAG: four helix bundle protein [Hymenobacter sp.]|nr:MAG: four helix bundle protein [Hymenobacter sp.]
MAASIIQQKSYAFACRIVKACKYLLSEPREFVLSKQLVRSGASVGANVEEALAASSTADFVHKLDIAAKEARETSYWLRLLHDNGFLPTAAFDSIYARNLEISKIIFRILLTTKEKEKAKTQLITHNQ